MQSEPAIIQVKDLGKDFRLYGRTLDRLAELFGGRQRHADFTALDNISLELGKGEVLGIIGENGSGKSTLLKLIAGILLPSRGQIKREGRITGLLELGTGFNPELSGRRNIYLNGVYLDIPRREMAKREQSIIDFAELGEFIDQPLKNYSSGMAMRLGFSIAIHADPDCFIIDEALSVGDARFQQKCFSKLREFREQGGSILFVSHDLNAIRLLCDRALLLHKGRKLFWGDPDDAVNRFNRILAEKGESGDNTSTGYGSGAIHFTSAYVADAQGKPVKDSRSGAGVSIHFSWECSKRVENVSFGFTIRDRFGQDIFGTNGALLGNVINIDGPGTGCFVISALNIGKGEYTISLAAHTGTTHLEKCFHWWDNAAMLKVYEDANYRFGGIVRLSASLDLAKNGAISRNHAAG